MTLRRYREGIMSEKEWVAQHSRGVQAYRYRDHYSFINRRKFNQMDGDEQRAYEAKLKKKIEQPEYRAYRRDDRDVFVVITKTTYLWALDNGIGEVTHA
jgi:hypothetical protein